MVLLSVKKPHHHHTTTNPDVITCKVKHDAKLGYKTVPLCITFGTLEDKNAFKDAARSLELNCKDSFPKQYAKQKDRALMYFKNSVLFNRWENKAKIQMLPSSTCGRMSESQKDGHVIQGID